MDKNTPNVKNRISHGREFTGKVVSTKMNKTVIVEVTQIFAHPLYHKPVRRNRRYAVHNDISELIVGDVVQIQESRPLSKRVHFIAVKKITG